LRRTLSSYMLGPRLPAWTQEIKSQAIRFWIDNCFQLISTIDGQVLVIALSIDPRSQPIAVGGAIEAPTFYARPANEITAAIERSEGIELDLGELYTRW